jgi:hypothetical protein
VIFQFKPNNVARTVRRIAVALLIVSPVLMVGCDGRETIVVEPQTYELTEQEADNRQRAEKILAEQRQ